MFTHNKKFMDKRFTGGSKTSFLVLVLALSCVRAGAATQVQSAGPYQQSCTSIHVDQNDTLLANCQDYFNRAVQTSLPHSSSCAPSSIGGGALPGAIWNVDGTLRCVYSSHPSLSGRDIFDIVSYSSEYTPSSQITVWRIDHPEVTTAQTIYEEVRFDPTETLVIDSGGCVQTGGKGLTWKSYVKPLGDESNRLYSGMIQVPTVIPTLVRVGTELKVPLHFPSGQQTAVSLTLGYQDDGFSDNGYYAHDNGDDNQCSGIGPAWVEITATTNVQSSRVKRK
jgi:hypothetical protein